MTTGVYPQEIVLRFDQPVQIEYLKIVSMNGTSAMN